MCHVVQELLRTVLADVPDRTQGVLISVECLTQEVVKGSEVDPVTGFGLLGKFDPTPVTEGETETSARHSLYKFVELGVPVDVGVAEWLGDVLRDVASDAGVVMDEPDVDDH